MGLPPKLEVDVEANSGVDEYDPWLLEDHPLRSHPSQCIPGLGDVLTDCYGRLTKHAKYLIRAVILVVGCFIFFHASQIIPALANYTFPHPAPHIDVHHWYVQCTFPHLDSRPSALTQSAAAGCNAFRLEIRALEGRLQMGPQLSKPRKENDLRVRLESLSTKLPTGHSAHPHAFHTSSSGTAAATGSESSRPFVLILDMKSPFEEIYPILLSELEILRHGELLGGVDHNALLPGQLMIVVTGELDSESYFEDGGDSTNSGIFWTSREDLESDDFTIDHVTPLRV